MGFLNILIREPIDVAPTPSLLCDVMLGVGLMYPDRDFLFKEKLRKEKESPKAVTRNNASLSKCPSLKVVDPVDFLDHAVA